jgi:hypothetical protein
LYTNGDVLESKTKFWSWYMRALRVHPEMMQKWFNIYDRDRYLKYLRAYKPTVSDIYTARPYKIHFTIPPRLYYDLKSSLQTYYEDWVRSRSPATHSVAASVAPYKYEFQRTYNSDKNNPYTYTIYYENRPLRSHPIVPGGITVTTIARKPKVYILPYKRDYSAIERNRHYHATVIRRGQIEAAAHPTLSDRISRERALDRALLNYPSHPNTRSYIPHADPLIPRPAYTSYYNPDLGRVVPRYGTVYDPDTLPKPQYSSTYYPDTYGRPWYYDPYFFYRYSY